jgi:ParB family chromosome partitioning protein
MPTRKRLGKGLGALLGETAVESVRAEGDSPSAGVRQIPIDRISPNRFQPRHTFHEDSIGELAASIAEQGVLQPLIVAPRGGDYELVSGERRWRAARIAGLSTVPVIVRDVDERQMLEIALVENLQREDLDAIDEAAGFRQLVDEFELTQAELARRVGKSRPAIANALRLLELPGAVREMVKTGELSAGHARALLGLDDRGGLAGLAREAADGGWSVRQLERRVRKDNAGPREAGAPERAHELERARLEEELQRSLGTKVRLRAGKDGKGRIEIAFYSFDDLDRLVTRLGAGG